MSTMNDHLDNEQGLFTNTQDLIAQTELLIANTSSTTKQNKKVKDTNTLKHENPQSSDNNISTDKETVSDVQKDTNISFEADTTINDDPSEDVVATEDSEFGTYVTQVGHVPPPVSKKGTCPSDSVKLARDFIQLVFGDAPGDVTNCYRITNTMNSATESNDSRSGKTSNSKKDSYKINHTSAKTAADKSGSILRSRQHPVVVGRNSMLKQAGVKPGMWCRALEVKLRPDVRSEHVYNTLTEIILSHRLVVILQEPGRLVAELRDHSLSAIGQSKELVNVVRTVTLIHGLSDQDKQRTLWICVVGGFAAAETTAETFGSYASSWASSLFEPSAKQQKQLSKGANAIFINEIFRSIQNGLLEANMTLNCLPIRPTEKSPVHEKPSNSKRKLRIEITVHQLLEPGGLSARKLDPEYLSSLKEVYKLKLDEELMEFAEPLEIYARDQEWRLAQLISLLSTTFQQCHLPMPTLDHASPLTSFPLEFVEPKPAVFHREPTTREVDTLTKHALSAKCFAESNARKKRKHLEITERVDVCERNREKYVSFLRDSEAASCSRETLEFGQLFNIQEPDVVFCAVNCLNKGKMGVLYITFNHASFYSSILGFRTRIQVELVNCRSVHKTTATGAFSVLPGDGILLREYKASDESTSQKDSNELIEHTFTMSISSDCARVFELLIQITRMRNTSFSDFARTKLTQLPKPVVHKQSSYGEPRQHVVPSHLMENSFTVDQPPIDLNQSNGTEAVTQISDYDIGNISIHSGTSAVSLGSSIASTSTCGRNVPIALDTLSLERQVTGDSDFGGESSFLSRQTSGTYQQPAFNNIQNGFRSQINVDHKKRLSNGGMDANDDESEMFYSSLTNISQSQRLDEAGKANETESDVDAVVRLAQATHVAHTQRTPLSPSIQALLAENNNNGS